MAELGPIPFTQTPAGAPDTELLARSVASLGNSIVSSYQEDILGELAGDLDAITESELSAATAEAELVTGSDQSQLTAENNGTVDSFTSQIATLRGAIANAPTQGAKARAELRLQQALSDAVKENGNIPGMRERLLREYQTFRAIDPELTKIGLADAQVSARSTRANQQLEEIRAYGSEVLEIDPSIPFGSQQYAEHYMRRSALHQRKVDLSMKSTMLEAQDNVDARALETSYYDHLNDRSGDFATLADSIAGPGSALTQLVRQRGNDNLSDSQKIDLEQQWAEIRTNSIVTIDEAIAKANANHYAIWRNLSDTPEAVAAKVALDQELSALTRVRTLMEDNKPQEAQAVLQTANVIRAAAFGDESPTVRAIRTVSDTLGTDGFNFIAKNDYFNRSVILGEAMRKGVMNDIGDLPGILTNNVGLVPDQGDINNQIDEALGQTNNPTGMNPSLQPGDNALKAATSLEAFRGFARSPEGVAGPTEATTYLKGTNAAVRQMLRNTGSVPEQDVPVLRELITDPAFGNLLEQTEAPEQARAYADSLLELMVKPKFSVTKWRGSLSELANTNVDGAPLFSYLQIDQKAIERGQVKFNTVNFPLDSVSSVSTRNNINRLRAQLEQQATAYLNYEANYALARKGGGQKRNYVEAFISIENQETGLNTLFPVYDLTPDEQTVGAF